ncbi:MAG TPA: helix-turn-helix domain-containing protein [Telluria sp.]|jgi:AraC-like DNA-binding protein
MSTAAATSTGTRMAFAPPAALARMVRYFHVECDSAGAIVVPASPWATVSFFIRGGSGGAGTLDGTDGPLLCGPLGKPFPGQWRAGTCFVAAQLEPRYLYLLFGVDAATMTDNPRNLIDVAPRLNIAQLEDTLQAGADPAAWVAALGDWLLRLLMVDARGGEPFAVPRPLLGLSTRDLADQFGLSVRQLERRYLAAYGMPVRASRRMDRYVDAMAALLRGPLGHGGLTRIAVDAGYHDQSHMMRDFAHYTGMGPTALAGSVASEVPQLRLFRYPPQAHGLVLRGR